MNYRVIDDLCQTVIAETDDFKVACDVALVNICRHPERGYTVIDDEGLDVLAREYE